MMEAYEMDEKPKGPSQVVVEEEHRVVANAYPGQRTEGTRNTNTRVKVRSRILLVNTMTID
jgi:hypothetical protein